MLALLACTCGETPDPVTVEPIEAVEDPYPALALDPLQAQLDSHAQALAGDDVCAMVTSARATSVAVEKHIFELEGDSGWEGEVFTQGQEWSDELVGVEFGWGSEGFYSGVAWDELPADEPLLGAAHGWLGEFGHSEWIRWSWDMGGCTDVERTGELAAALTASWNEAPDCLRQLVEADLRRELEMLSRHHCYCTDQPTAAAQIEAIAPRLSAMPLGGADVLASMKAGLGEARFDDSECAGR